MPLIAYIRAHGVTDFPHHFAFFGHLEKLGLLDRYQFALDTIYDPMYCLQLIDRFPQLKLVDDVSRPRWWLKYVQEHVGRGYRPLAYLDKFDAVCESPGGRINGMYMHGDVFRMYPRVERRAILFHSIEFSALEDPGTKASIAAADLVVARTHQSAENAKAAGAKWVCASSDIVFLEHPRPIETRPGIVVALRLPNRGVTESYLTTLRDIVARLEKREGQVDFVRIEEPMGREMIIRGLGSYRKPNAGLYYEDTMYLPFLHRRDAIISARLHTTLVSLLYGNRKILQFHIELGTNKSEEILGDIGLHSLKVHRQPDVCWPLIEQFLEEEQTFSEAEAQSALSLAKSKTMEGMNAFLEWLDTIK